MVLLDPKVTKDNVPFFKRRKPLSFNSRVDRMVESLNYLHQSPRSPTRKTKNTSNSSISPSIGSSRPSHSPLKAYSHLQGQLGKDFSLLNGSTYPILGEGLSGVAPSVASTLIDEDIQASPPLPEWLQKTFLTLEPTNPLRLLLPPETQAPILGVVVEYNHAMQESLPFVHRTQSQEQGQENRSRSNVESITMHSKQMSHPSPTREPPRSLNSRESRQNQSTVLEADKTDLLPFSTPGPGLSLTKTSKMSYKPPSDLDTNREKLLDIDSTRTSPLVLKSGYVYESHSDFTANVLRLPYPTGFSELTTGYSPGHSTEYNQDHLTDDSGSDTLLDPPLHPIYDLQHLYTTPNRSRPPIYFDSPIEDPSSSASMQLGYEINYDALDFRWKPYFRDKKDTGKGQLVVFSDHQSANETKSGDPHLDENAQNSKMPHPPSPSPFRFSLDQQEDLHRPIKLSGGRGNQSTLSAMHRCQHQETSSKVFTRTSSTQALLLKNSLSNSPPTPPAKRRQTSVDILDGYDEADQVLPHSQFSSDNLWWIDDEYS